MVSGTSSTKLMKGTPNKKKIPSSVSTVISNSDLLIEILVRLPVVSHLLFKSISKHWLSLIKSPSCIFCHQSQNSNLLGSPYGILIKRYNVDMRMLEYDFESFDVRIPSKRSILFSLGSETPLGDVDILHACNGLLLCRIRHELYVYNPTINQCKRLRGKLTAYSSNRMAFDPTKSPHYKVIQLDDYEDDEFGEHTVQIRIYSSQTGEWSVCGERFHKLSFAGFNEGVYWNDAIHWLTNASWMKFSHFKLDVENELPVLNKIKFPATFDRKSDFKARMYESRGCLLLLGKDHAHSRRLNIYEMRNGYLKWSVKYVVNLDDIMRKFPKTWSIPSRVWCIVLGEREEDSFMIVDLLSKVVQYNPVLKTVRTLSDLESAGKPLRVYNFGGFQSLHLLQKSDSAFCFRRLVRIDFWRD